MRLGPAELQRLQSIIRNDPAREDRFWAKVDRRGPDECWPWIGGGEKSGYGCFGFQVGQDKSRSERAHRVAWVLAGNDLPVFPLVIDHTCRNRGCVNVRHMRIVTQRINTVENSASPFAVNAAKTHCPKGHPYSGENVCRMLKRSKKWNRPWQVIRICLTCRPEYSTNPRRFWLPEDLAA